MVERIHGLLGEESSCAWRRWFAGAALLLALVFGVFAGSALAFTDVGFGISGRLWEQPSRFAGRIDRGPGLGIGSAAGDHRALGGC